jgi:TP901 family phage tail tape measure protein
MANSVQKTIEIIFAGNDKVSGTIDTVSGGLSDFGGRVEAISGPLADLSDSILKIDAALLALGAVGLAYAYAKSAEFESAVIELEKVLGDQPEALEKAKIAAFELSAQYGESSATVLLSAASFKQAGFDIEESLLLTKAAMDLSIAGNIGSAESSELLIATLKGFKAPAEDVTRLVDVLNEVSNEYSTNVRELGVGMAALSPIASLMGFSFEETAGILTPVIEIFRSGDEAAVALKMGLLKLIDDAKPVQDALASIGVAQKDANGELRSGKDILYDVALAFQTAEENDKLFLAAQLVGIRQAGKMVEVFDGLAKSTEITSVAMGAAGSAAKEVALRMESAEIIVDRFKTGFTNLAIVIGDQFLEAAKEAISGGTDIENALRNIIKDEDSTFAPVFDALGEFGENLGDYLSGIAEAMPEAFAEVDFEGLLDALGDLGDEIVGMFDGLDLTKPENLKTAIQFVIDSLESLVVVTTGMAGPLGDFIGKIVDLIDGFNKLDSETKETTGSVLGWGKVVDTIIGPLGSLLKAVESLAVGLNVLVGIKVLSWIKDLSGISAITIPIGLATGIVAIGTAILGIGTALAADKLADWLTDIGVRIPTGLPEFIETTQAEFDAMNAVIDEVNASLDSMDFKSPVVDVKAMLADPAFSDTEIQYAITGELSDLEKALAEAGVLVKEKPVIVAAETTKAVEKIEKVKEAVKEIPHEKLLEIKLQGEIDTEIAIIVATAETAQTAMEWTAKLNIAEAEADAKVLVAMFDGIAASITSTGDVLGGLFGLLAGDDLDIGAKWDIERQIEKESKMRDEAFDQQSKLNAAQLKYMEARTAALEAGEGLITITADGLEPELEAFMWKILEKIQIRANEANAEFLLGV